MPKTGKARSDGKVFLRYNKASRNGESWVTMENFLKVNGSDWYERRARMNRNVEERAKKKVEMAEKKIEMTQTKEQRDEERKEKKRIYARERQAKLRRENPEKGREADRRYHDRHKNDPDYIRRYREASLRHYYKVNAEKIKERQEANRLKAIDDEVKRVEKIKRLAEKTQKKKAKELAKSLRPKRVVLTEEQRKEYRRQEKRNYKHKRRAILRGLESKATAGQIREAKAKAKGKCFYCSMRVKVLTIDHVLPICSGGSHTLDNIVFACHACNSRKSGTHPNAFGREFGLLLV